MNDCCTCAAAAYAVEPLWSAAIVQVPAPMSATVEPVTVQTPALDAAAEKATARPDVAVAASA